MKLVIQNTILGGSSDFLLKSDTLYVLGREVRSDTDGMRPDIPIQSRFASERQAELEIVRGSLVVRHFGVNPTKLNDELLAYDFPVEMNEGDILQIGEYTANLMLKEFGDSGGDNHDLHAGIVMLEGEIHNQLLDLLDLRRNPDAINKTDDATRAKIGRILEKLVSEAVEKLSNNEFNFLIRRAIYLRLNSEITRAGDDEVTNENYVEFENAFFENSIQDIGARMLQNIGAELNPKTMREDNDLLDLKFLTTFADFEYELSTGLGEYLTSMHIKKNILDLIFGYGPLEELLTTPSISEIMVVSSDTIFVEKYGVIENSRRSFYNDASLMSVLEKIVAPVSKRIDRSNPYVDARLPDGSRVNAVIPPLAIKGPCITIRKFSATPITMQDLHGFGAFDESMLSFLKACVENHLNIVVSGGTGSGKTTMLNCLSSFISPSERVITIEDTAELQLKQQHVVTLESRAANMEGKGEVTMRDLVKNALRMRPDRIVVGECRGVETLDMLQAMNTGHDGSMTTAHANNPVDMMKRLETMVLTGIEMPISAIRTQIVSAVNIVVQLNRLSSGERKVTHISEITTINEDTGEILVEDIYVYNETDQGGYHSYTGYIPEFLLPMVEKGSIDPYSFFSTAKV